MKLTVLMDNHTLIDQYFIGEPAVSYYIEADGKKILFDAGYSDAYLRNAAKMGIDLTEIDFVVLSHGHLDHTWGLPYLINEFVDKAKDHSSKAKPILVAHPDVFTSRRVEGMEEIGPNLTADQVSEHFNLFMTKEPFYLTANLVFLGEIPRGNSFEARQPLGEIRTAHCSQPDFLLDDSALAYKSPEGLVIITGCSHSGICNIISASRDILGESRIVDVIGGLHLLQPPKEQLRKTTGFLKEISPLAIHACHCTDLPSKIALSKVVNNKEVGVGLVLEY